MIKRATLTGVLISLFLGAAFWGTDAVLVAVLDKERLSSLAVRNLVLGLFAALWFKRVYDLIPARIQPHPLLFIAFLWILGGVASAFRSLVLEEATVGLAVKDILTFPLTTIEVATYSGILPALMLCSIVPLFRGKEKSA